MYTTLKHSMLGVSLLCASLCAPLSSHAQVASGYSTNPLIAGSKLPFGAPDFRIIRGEHYLPAIKAGIAQQRAAIKEIVDNKKKPTFKNTVLAYEKSGELLDRVTSVFFGLTSAHKTSDIEAAEPEAIRLLTEFGNEVSFNQAFFDRVKYVYDNERSKLKGEDQKLLEETYKGFVRSGALLSDADKKRMEEINNRSAKLQQDFLSMLPKATNAAAVWVDTKEELAGLSDADIAQCAADAKARGGKAPYCIVVVNTTQQDILASLDNRSLRERVFNASLHRADGTNEFNTYPIIAELAKLRAEKAKLLGYDTYAAYALDNKMAKNAETLNSFLRNLIEAYKPKAEAETEAIEAFAQQTEGPGFRLKAYDRNYYSAKMKQAKFAFSEDDVKPYFNLDSVLVNGVFYAASRAYGLKFKERKDIPLYHEDMKVYDVLDNNGKQIALFYTDYYRRPTKRGGAWMSSFAKQSRLRKQIPVIYNVCNYAKAPAGQPTLLNWDEVTTLFHEFGHGLHGMLSDCEYNTLSGTAVTRDFVELPSQFNEAFASVPEVFNNYAKHYKTGRPMPKALKEKMLESLNFHSAYALGENLAATCLDLAWHSSSATLLPTAESAADFQALALQNYGLLDEQIPPRYGTSYFNHVWGGGYATGYYSYLWSEVLAVNVADFFRKHGFLNPKVGAAFRKEIISRGNTDEPMTMFTKFTGLKSPDAKAILKARGL